MLAHCHFLGEVTPWLLTSRLCMSFPHFCEWRTQWMTQVSISNTCLMHFVFSWCTHSSPSLCCSMFQWHVSTKFLSGPKKHHCWVDDGWNLKTKENYGKSSEQPSSLILGLFCFSPKNIHKLQSTWTLKVLDYVLAPQSVLLFNPHFSISLVVEDGIGLISPTF